MVFIDTYSMRVPLSILLIYKQLGKITYNGRSSILAFKIFFLKRRIVSYFVVCKRIQFGSTVCVFLCKPYLVSPQYFGTQDICVVDGEYQLGMMRIGCFRIEQLNDFTCQLGMHLAVYLVYHQAFAIVQGIYDGIG